MMLTDEASLHRLGWKGFQDLCIALVEERLGRVVQTFLPTADAGRDGAFLGTWDDVTGESTIQCKFTSKESENLTLSDLRDELPKAALLAARGLAADYVILTNHGVTGSSELRIREAFENAGVGRCRVFHRDWIAERVRTSPKLRMMVPRLYGFTDLTAILDDRAYRQAQLILSEMGDNLQRFVVTDAHRKSVRAISQHRLVLLLGSPAAGKSTIGASLALGAADAWNSLTIKSTSPEHLGAHIDPAGGQFFWIDDAWGSTQYQRERTEAWNQVFPLMHGAMRRGTKFLITSRDYIWNQARRELKLQALPILNKSQVVINVHELTLEEKAQILYNHLKFGDQDEGFKNDIRPLLPAVAARADFLPESARRVGSSLFTPHLELTANRLADFFGRPSEFLEQTIEGLSMASQAAIALVFLNGGKVRSPVPPHVLERPALTYGVDQAALRLQLEALNGSILNLVEDEEGPFWTYRHPTVGDSFAANVAKSPEMIETFLLGAKPETILQEIVCAGVSVMNAKLIVPNQLLDLLLSRIAGLGKYRLVAFMSYRANRALNEKLLMMRPEIWSVMEHPSAPLRDDLGVGLLVTLHEQGLLPPDRRAVFVREVQTAVNREADASVVDSYRIQSVLTTRERVRIFRHVKRKVLGGLARHVRRVRDEWDPEYDPANHFDGLRASLKSFSGAVFGGGAAADVCRRADALIAAAEARMQEQYKEPVSDQAPSQPSTTKTNSLAELFRDVAE